MATRVQSDVKNKSIDLVFKNCFPIFQPVALTGQINHFTLEQ